MDTTRAAPDLICFSHLRWNFVFQRPQHLMSRFAKERRVFYFEEPVFDAHVPVLVVTPSKEGVEVAVPHLPEGMPPDMVIATQRALLDQLILNENISSFVTWYYTPMSRSFSAHLQPDAIAYDCMDELSMFKGAHEDLLEHERELLSAADVVFTGGQSLYEFKKDRHPNVHPFPSSVDVAHFSKARTTTVEPEDQRSIPHPRLGFFGVLDERFDAELTLSIALARPDWQIVLVGPIVKIDPASLPRLSNIHYLGSKKYDELPAYIAGWDVALLLFARNDATRFISPTKTPEYLAAGKPVVSTSITDVVRPYAVLDLVRIADDAKTFTDAVQRCLSEDGTERRKMADALLKTMSWDRTWARMKAMLDAAAEAAARENAEESA